MTHRLYNFFIAPRFTNRDLRSRELVLNVILATTLVIMLLALLLLLRSVFISNEAYIAITALCISAGIGLVCGIYRLIRSGHYTIGATLLVVLYFIITGGVLYEWGTRLPMGIALCSLVIVLSGILLGARQSLFAVLAVFALLGGMRFAEQKHALHPNEAWIYEPPGLNGVVGLVLIFGLLAVITWLFNYQMERSLRRAQQAEAALLKQKESLEVEVQERTRELHLAQLEKIQQIHRFAELGQLSTGLLHELANHLTVLTLDIESLEAHNRSHLLKRAKRSIRYIDDMVHRVRDQLHGKSEVTSFNMVSEISAVVKILNHKAQEAGVQLQWQPVPKKRLFRYNGDSIRFRQLVANLISNAIDASATAQPQSANTPKVAIAIEALEHHLRITITDWGEGISAQECKKVFEPFYGTKKTGMGMGLFISKQLTEEYFGGTLELACSDRTVFTITIPSAA